jgi:GNAT superfamily N-acetyltransferase
MQFHSDELEFCGYFPGVVGDIIKLHAVYYNENWGFDVTFETQVSSELANFIREFQKDRDDFLVARLNGKFAGSVAIDGCGAEFAWAKLCWFIVEPDFHYRGIGRALIRKVVRFCRDVDHGVRGPVERFDRAYTVCINRERLIRKNLPSR